MRADDYANELQQTESFSVYSAQGLINRLAAHIISTRVDRVLAVQPCRSGATRFHRFVIRGVVCHEAIDSKQLSIRSEC